MVDDGPVSMFQLGEKKVFTGYSNMHQGIGDSMSGLGPNFCDTNVDASSVIFVRKIKTRTRIIGRRFQRTRTRIIVIQKTKTK